MTAYPSTAGYRMVHQLARNNVGGKYQPRGFFKWQPIGEARRTALKNERLGFWQRDHNPDGTVSRPALRTADWTGEHIHPVSPMDSRPDGIRGMALITRNSRSAGKTKHGLPWGWLVENKFNMSFASHRCGKSDTSFPRS